MREEINSGGLLRGAELFNLLFGHRRREPLLVVLHKNLRGGKSARLRPPDRLADPTARRGMRAQKHSGRNMQRRPLALSDCRASRRGFRLRRCLRCRLCFSRRHGLGGGLLRCGRRSFCSSCGFGFHGIQEEGYAQILSIAGISTEIARLFACRDVLFFNYSRNKSKLLSS